MKTKKRTRYGRVAIAIAIAAIVTPAGYSPAEASPELGADMVRSLALYDSPQLQAVTEQAVQNGANTDQLETLIQVAYDSDLTAEILVEWVGRLDGVAAKQLPISPVTSRYLQGLAKNVPPARIDAAAGELESRLSEAAWRIDAVCDVGSDPVSQRSRMNTIDHGAYALGLGVTSMQLDQSISLAWEDNRSIQAIEAPVLTLGILVASGIPPVKSMEVVDAAWVHGYRGVDLARLGKALGRLGSDGQGPPAEVVAQVLEMIGKDTAQDRVFRDLDELMGREDYRLDRMLPGDDPTMRRGGDPSREDNPTDTPKDNRQPGPFERDTG